MNKQIESYNFSHEKYKHIPFYPSYKDITYNNIREISCRIRIKHGGFYYWFVVSKTYHFKLSISEYKKCLDDFNLGCYLAIIGSVVNSNLVIDDSVGEYAFVLDKNQVDEVERLTTPSIKE